jgi:hypothetical protein
MSFSVYFWVIDTVPFLMFAELLQGELDDAGDSLWVGIDDDNQCNFQFIPHQ